MKVKMLSLVFLVLPVSLTFCQTLQIRAAPASIQIDLSNAPTQQRLQLTLVDPYGNSRPASRSIVLTFRWSGNRYAGTFYTTANQAAGTGVSQVTIPQGQASVTIYFRPRVSSVNNVLEIRPQDNSVLGCDLVFSIIN